MSFLYLLVGHLLGDFLFQTDKIAMNKVRNRRWNGLHALVVTLCMLLMSIPFGWLVMLLVAVDGVLHHYIDLLKPYLSDKLKLPTVFYFILDQAIHISLIFVISMFSVSNESLLLMDEVIIKFLVIVLLTTSFSAVLCQIILNEIFPNIKKRFFEGEEKWTGIFTRLFLAVSIYYTLSDSWYYIYLALTVSSIFFAEYFFAWRKWMSLSFLILKYVLDLCIALIAGIVLYQLY